MKNEEVKELKDNLSMAEKVNKVAGLVLQELLAAEKKHGEANKNLGLTEWFVVMQEEIGEISKDVCELLLLDVKEKELYREYTEFLCSDKKTSSDRQRFGEKIEKLEEKSELILDNLKKEIIQSIAMLYRMYDYIEVNHGSK